MEPDAVVEAADAVVAAAVVVAAALVVEPATIPKRSGPAAARQNIIGFVP